MGHGKSKLSKSRKESNADRTKLPNNSLTTATSTPTTPRNYNSENGGSWSRRKAEEFFMKYKTANSEGLGPDEIIRLCTDLQISPEDISVLVLAWHLQAKVMGFFTKEEFLEGLKRLHIESFSQLKSKIRGLKNELADPTTFRDVFKFAFCYNKEGDSKVIDLQTADSLILLLFNLTSTEDSQSSSSNSSSDSKQYFASLFREFLKQSAYKAVNMDQWTSFLDFSTTISKDLSNYDPDGALLGLLEVFEVMPLCAPVKTPDDFWATIKRDDSNVLLCQKSDIGFDRNVLFNYRICIAADEGGTLLQIAISFSLEAIELDWKWALNVLSNESKKRSPTPDKLALVFVTLWNKTHSKTDRVTFPPSLPSSSSYSSYTSTLTSSSNSTQTPEGEQPVCGLGFDPIELEHSADEIGLIDDTTCRALHIIDHFDSHGYPLLIQKQKQQSQKLSTSKTGKQVRQSLPAHIVSSQQQQQKVSSAEEDALKQVQQRRLRLALNGYRFVTKQPQSLPGQRQRIAKEQLIAAISSTATESMTLPPHPSGTAPKPTNLIDSQQDIIITTTTNETQKSPRKNAQIRPKTQQIGSSTTTTGINRDDLT